MTHIEAMKQALEALESCGEGHITDGGYQWHDAKLVDTAITSICQAIAELESQEPVAWRLNGESSLGHGKVFGDWKSGNPPADVADLASVDKNWSLEFAYTTHPPQRKPLTNLKEALVEAMSIINHYGMHGWSKAAHDEGERVMRNARKALAVHNIKE
jgi:hypothetical protein